MVLSSFDPRHSLTPAAMSLTVFQLRPDPLWPLDSSIMQVVGGLLYAAKLLGARLQATTNNDVRAAQLYEQALPLLELIQDLSPVAKASLGVSKAVKALTQTIGGIVEHLGEAQPSPSANDIQARWERLASDFQSHMLTLQLALSIHTTLAWHRIAGAAEQVMQLHAPVFAATGIIYQAAATSSSQELFRLTVHRGNETLLNVRFDLVQPAAFCELPAGRLVLLVRQEQGTNIQRKNVELRHGQIAILTLYSSDLDKATVHSDIRYGAMDNVAHLNHTTELAREECAQRAHTDQLASMQCWRRSVQCCVM